MLTLKLPPQLDAQVQRASAAERISKSEWARRALTAQLAQTQAAPRAAKASALDLAGDLAGCFDGGPKDLSTNPRHMADFGKV
jgi:hypothetical protein